MHSPRKRAYLKGYREFESPPLRHTLTDLLESKDNQQKTNSLHQFPSVALVAVVAQIPSFTLDLHDKTASA